MTEDSALRELPSKYVEWKIANFRNLRTKVNHEIQSPRFSLANAIWYLQICPKGESRCKSFGWIGLYLMKEGSAAKYRAAYKIGIKKADGSELQATEDEYVFKKWGEGHGTTKLIKRSVLLGTEGAVGFDNSVTVFCSVRIVNGLPVTTSGDVPASMKSLCALPPAAAIPAATFKTPSTVATVEAASQTSSPPESTGDSALHSDGSSTLVEDLKNIYISRSYTDITILVQNKKFYAHKNILGGRSAVFASMFEHEFVEKKSGEVEISDCDPDSFEQFLLFLYTGKMDGMVCTKAVHLYKISDKYDVKELKEECVRCMVRDVSVDSFCDVMHLATIYNDSDLLKAATDVFIDNIEAILPTAKWQQFLEDNTSLCNELLIKAMKSKK